MATDTQALARLAADTKAVCATSSDVTRAAGSSAGRPAAKAAAKVAAYHAKTSVITHSFFLVGIGGIVIGLAAYHFANKYLQDKENATEQNTAA